jgi:hypothetical protein
MMLAMVPYLEDCVLLRAVARALSLPLPVAATALAYLHRCRRSSSGSGAPSWTLPPRDLVCGCLYAAAKAEEVGVCDAGGLCHLVRPQNGAGGGPAHKIPTLHRRHRHFAGPAVDQPSHQRSAAAVAA